MPGYAVLDLETTGFNAAGTDRIVEIAIVNLDPTGAHQATWPTLVNPLRDLGPVHIHGIAAADVRHAPTFEDLVPDVVAHLAGRVIIAHNAAFDTRFLAASLARVGADAPDLAPISACTMRLAHHYLPGVKSTLAACCERAGISLQDAHAAEADATATAHLFRHYLSCAGVPGDPFQAWHHPTPWLAQNQAADAAPWPTLAPAGIVPVRRGAASGSRVNVLERVAPAPHRALSEVEADPYFDALVRAMLDRQVSARESEELVRVAAACGMDRLNVRNAHIAYLLTMARRMVADSVVSKAEYTELVDAADVLGLGETEVTWVLERAIAGKPGVRFDDSEAVGPQVDFRLQAGDVVEFTGDMQLARQEWVQRATDAGLTVGANVTKKTTLVVAADPDSLSGKARKAEAYGIPIVTEGAFERMIAWV